MRRDLFISAVLIVAALILFGLAFTTAARADDTWPCRLAGWEVGDVWGPGPDDVVPDVPLCEPETPAASGEPTLDIQAEAPVIVIPRVTLTPPPTDT